MSVSALYSRSEFRKLPEEFRTGLVISDGMWYTPSKLAKIAKVPEEYASQWIQENLESGRLVQANSGAPSYRFPLESIYAWFAENGLEPGSQVVDFLHPARIWGGMTETEGFLQAPLREISMIGFKSSPEFAAEVTEALRGVARVRETDPGEYKAYGLDAGYIKGIVERVVRSHPDGAAVRLNARGTARRREMCDFSREFSQGIVLFYRKFGKVLVRRHMETIAIFMPDPEDQEAQIVDWAIAAIEKFDESAAVPFSGYLNAVLNRWPYDLPDRFLGKELSGFQRRRAKALSAVRERTGEETASHHQLAEEMDCEVRDFLALEERHKTWIAAKMATTLTWEEGGDEKGRDGVLEEAAPDADDTGSYILKNRLSFCIIQAALETGQFDDALFLASLVDKDSFSPEAVSALPEAFVKSLGEFMGMGR